MFLACPAFPMFIEKLLAGALVIAGRVEIEVKARFVQFDALHHRFMEG